MSRDWRGVPGLQVIVRIPWDGESHRHFPVATLLLPLEPKMPSDRSREAGKADIVSRYAAAVLTVVIALLLRGLLEPLLGYHNAYHTVWLAVVVSTWYCGLGPAIVATCRTSPLLCKTPRPQFQE